MLVRDLIFVFQNIEGEYIHYDSIEDAYRLDKKVNLRSSWGKPLPSRLIVNLCVMDWLDISFHVTYSTDQLYVHVATQLCC